MDFLTDILGVPLGYVMQLCHMLVSDYGFAIILFTLLTKIIILPVGIWVHKNSIKMVKIQPAINRIKAKFFGDGERIAAEQSKLFKKEKYKPLVSLVPLAIQIILLLGVVAVIYHPFQYVFHTPDPVVGEMYEIANENLEADIDVNGSYAEIELMQAVKTNPQWFSEFASGSEENKLAVENAQNFDLNFFGFDLSWNPSAEIATNWVVIIAPIIAGLSSWFLCVMQNKINVLQSEQGKGNQYGTMIFSVGLSLYLGFFVPSGVALYWVASNLFAILQVVFLNAVIPPKKYVDYEELEASRQELAALNSLGDKKKPFQKDPNAKREKADYKRFFSIANKHLVIWSEKSGFYKYFENIINSLLKNTSVTIHYVTNDPDDQIFEIAKSEPKIKPYYIGPKKIITFMMKMDADIVLMTTPDLDKYHIKRSYVRKDIEYIYTFHGPTSTTMCVKEGAYDAFDTIFCVGPHQVTELQETVRMYNLPEKTLVPVGFGVIDNLIESYKNMEKKPEGTKKQILIAPSWQEDNILESCLDEILPQFIGKGNKVILRPHPEFIKRFRPKMDAILEKWQGKDGDDFIIEMDFSSNRTIWESDLLVTDWSGIAYEFSYATKKPSMFINTTPKVLNPNYEKYSTVPAEISWKDQVGVSLEMNELDKVEATVAELLGNPDKYRDKIEEALKNNIFNIGESGKAGAKYIYQQIAKRQQKANETKKK